MWWKNIFLKLYKFIERKNFLRIWIYQINDEKTSIHLRKVCQSNKPSRCRFFHCCVKFYRIFQQCVLSEKPYFFLIYFFFGINPNRLMESYFNQNNWCQSSIQSVISQGNMEDVEQMSSMEKNMMRFSALSSITVEALGKLLVS